VNSKIVLTAALNGLIAAKKDIALLPTTPREIAGAATRARHAGAAAMHVHLRDALVPPTTDLDIARKTVDLIREESLVLLRLSTGVGFGPDPSLLFTARTA